MLRVNQSVLAAVAGVALVGASPSVSPETKGNQSQAENGRDAKLDRIASAVEELPKAQPPDRGCEPGKDDYQSDLCAQWKAAIAASESARWSWWTMLAGFVGLAIGAGTLFAAWRAAHWARQAAEHTEAAAIEAKRSADEAEKAAKAGIDANKITRALARPWVAVTCKFTKCQPVGSSLLINGELTYKNVGSTPALDFSHFRRCNFNTEEEADKITEFVQKTHQILGSGNALMPNEAIIEPFNFELEIDDSSVFEDEGMLLLQVFVTASAT